jgi:hypothetical protein
VVRPGARFRRRHSASPDHAHPYDDGVYNDYHGAGDLMDDLERGLLALLQAA